MAKQTLTFVVLPNGPAAGGKLRVSVYLTPRLSGASKLQSFPDVLHWTERIKTDGLKFTFTSGPQSATAAVDRSVLRPDIWEAIFRPSTFVEKYRVPRYDRRLFVSYPGRDAAAFVKYAYQTLARDPFGDNERENILSDLLSDLVFRDGTSSTLDRTLSELRVTMWREQQADGIEVPAARFAGPAAVELPPDGVPTSLNQPAATRQMAAQAALFHHMPPAHHRPPLPHTEAEFAKTLDFHRALTALNSYPWLLRALGLVFDLEVPATLCALSPAVPGDPYSTVAVKSVTPNFAWKVEPVFFLPATSYFRDKNSFDSAPATASIDLINKDYLPGDVIGGLLALSPQFFHLSEFDLDGCLLNLLSLADAAAFADVRASQGSPSQAEFEQILPALRSGGISLVADGRAIQLLQSVRDNLAFDAALAGNSSMRPFNARDLVRGYRIDIRSSASKEWYSLHQRNGTYRFGADGKLVFQVNDEEGFTQLAAAQPAEDPTRKTDKIAKAAGAPQPGTDIYVHERVVRWNGWSLSVPRPGGSLNRSADPAHSTDADPTMNQPKTPFKMVAGFSPVNGTLPKLRFGDRYRLRARAVDLAGNSVPLKHSQGSDLAASSTGELPYLRFEPVPHPILLLREDPKSGGSIDRLVIRSHNSRESLDTVPSNEIDQRHVVPPRTSVRMVECHRMFDDAQRKLKGDAATYNMIATRDKAEFPVSKGVPLESRAQATTPFLPDPIARGAAFGNLPNTPTNTNGRIQKETLTYTRLPDVEGRPGSVTFVDFGSDWPARVPFRMATVEGRKAPQWDAAHRVLTIYLPKAFMGNVPLSSYLDPGDLSIMGVWQWLRELFDFVEAQSLHLFSGPVEPADEFALLTRVTLEGGHPMITPAKTLTLVHAVQQPIGRPRFSVLPVIRPSQLGKTGTLANAFAPITAWRQYDSHEAALLGGLEVHGASTAKVDLQASWTEYIDDPSDPEPTRKKASSHVEKFELPTLDAGTIFSDASLQQAVATYIPQGDVLWFSAPGDSIPGMTAPLNVTAPVHKFEDTKHRRVRYRAVATSRFREYFADQTLDFTRTSDSLGVTIPSSARPASPDLMYVLPIFGSEQQESTNIKTAIRRGNGIRVYLQRPWYSSGAHELLGVVLWQGAAAPPDTAARETFKPYFTQWGQDPIWQTGPLAAVPETFHFSNAVMTKQSLTLEETTLPVDVAGHCVFFDPRRKLWYSDIVMFNSSTYAPFVRLALARFQPHSLPGVELSKVVLADFAQLSPDRSAVLSVAPAAPRTARVFVGGLVPEGPTQTIFTVDVERRMANVISDLGWEPAPANEVTVTQDPPGSADLDMALWSGSVRFVKDPPADRYRVVVREFEVLSQDPQIAGIGPTFGQRLVYAAILPYDFPTSPGDLRNPKGGKV
jgi:hypothetical protein